MAGTLSSVVDISKSIHNLTKLFAKTLFLKSYDSHKLINNNILSIQKQSLLFYTTQNELPKQDDKNTAKNTSKTPPGLMEFFDDPKNWGMEKVKAGRSWKIDELRLKIAIDVKVSIHKYYNDSLAGKLPNTDFLHLFILILFVLLKEKNMLKTMEHACNEAIEIFPNPERIDKVEDSMENIEKVVRERNNAYYYLETGDHGERPSKMVYNQIGLKYWYRLRQYLIPRRFNTKFNKENIFQFGGYAVAKFRRLYFEKLWNQKRREKNLCQNKIKLYFRRYPNVDIDAIQAEFPNFTREEIEKLKRSKRSQGHFIQE